MDEILSSFKLKNNSLGSAFMCKTHFIFVGNSLFTSLKKSTDSETMSGCLIK